MLRLAEWAGHAYERYDNASVQRIVQATAAAGAANARRHAELAVKETGFGVVEHKLRKNLAYSTGRAETYAGYDYVSPRYDPITEGVAVPHPQGVVVALTPSTSPVATVLLNVLS